MSTTNWPITDTEITFYGDYTCTHHNDQQRAACPVCLVATLTAERDQLRAEVKSCGELSCDECNARTAALTARAEKAEEFAKSMENQWHKAEAGLAKEQAYVSALEDQLDSYGLEMARKQAGREVAPP